MYVLTYQHTIGTMVDVPSAKNTKNYILKVEVRRAVRSTRSTNSTCQ
jgi:hypothetical protein